MKEDAILESAEIVLYDTLIQLAQKASTVVGGDAIPILTQNLDEEIVMMDWIKANTPVLITQLWPDIAASVVGTEVREVYQLRGSRRRKRRTRSINYFRHLILLLILRVQYL